MKNNENVSESSKSEGEQNQSTALQTTKMTSEIVIPDVVNAKKAMAAFETLKRDMLQDGKDYVHIQGKLAITRAGFSKIALAFRVNTEVIKITRISTKEDYIVHIITRASMLNGRYTDAIASCSMSEFRDGLIKGTIANVEAKAATRSKSRAIADLVGGGVLSVEELNADEEAEKQQIQMMSSRQRDYIIDLCSKQGKAPIDLIPLLQKKPQTEWSYQEASDVITELKKLPVATKQ